MFVSLVYLLMTVTDDVSFSDLKEREVVQLITTRDQSIYRAVKSFDDNKVTVVDIETLEEQVFEKSKLKAIRSGLTDRRIAEVVGIGPWVAWQLSPFLDGASKRQTVASIQQSTVYVTANAQAGLMVGDEVVVFRLGEAVKDPATGELLELPEQKIAKMEVIGISERLVTCRPTGDIVIQLQIGDVVRPVQSRTSVAVLPFVNSVGQPVQSGIQMADATTNAMVKLGIPTLERTRTVEILGEQIRQLANVYEGGDASRIGKLLGAATLVTGRILEDPKNKRLATLSVRLIDVRTGAILKAVELELSASKLQLTPEATAASSTKSGKPKPGGTLDELRDAVIAAGALAEAMMVIEEFTAEETEYVAKYVNRGPDSVDGSMPELLDHEEIQAWIKAERAYVKKRDASGRR